MTSPAIDDWMLRDAVISDCGRYRYELKRSWDPSTAKATFVMLNPSTADAQLDDPTIRRCIGFARNWGYGGIRVVNLYAYRATDPSALGRTEDPVGERNDDYLADAGLYARACGAPLIAAWGVNAGAERVEKVLTLPGFERLSALGLTKDGHPRHPLYLRADAELSPWPATS